jgi:phosphatidylserine/phosphatidylglycerophosphate/cardiolipin synthase-like enzyme
LRKNPNLRISILTDALRGTRETPEPSSASLLVPLVEEFGERRVEIRMFHTPNLTGIRKATIPRRINEGWGLQHMKLYGIDDEVILSGYDILADLFVLDANLEAGPIFPTTTSQIGKTDIMSSPVLISPSISLEFTTLFAN